MPSLVLLLSCHDTRSARRPTSTGYHLMEITREPVGHDFSILCGQFKCVCTYGGYGCPLAGYRETQLPSMDLCANICGCSLIELNWKELFFISWPDDRYYHSKLMAGGAIIINRMRVSFNQIWIQVLCPPERIVLQGNYILKVLVFDRSHL